MLNIIYPIKYGIFFKRQMGKIDLNKYEINNKHCCYSCNDNCLDLTLYSLLQDYLSISFLDITDNEIETNLKVD